MQYTRVFAALLAMGAANQIQAQGADWTGLYGGAQIDLAMVDMSNLGGGATTNEGNGLMFGATGGYRFDLGNVVLGTSATVSFGSVRVPPVGAPVPQDPALNALMTVGVEAGYDLGQVLVFGEIGHTWATMRNIAGSRRYESGMQYGVGADYMLSDMVIVGGGVTHTNLDNFSGSDVSVTSFGLRAAYRF